MDGPLKPEPVFTHTIQGLQLEEFVSVDNDLLNRPTSDDLARAIFAEAESAGSAVPRDQSTRVIREIERLCAGREIMALRAATVAGAAGYVVAIVGKVAHLARWEADSLELSFLGKLPGLRYRERTRALGGMPVFEGEPCVEMVIEHARLPGPTLIEAGDWNVGLLEQVRATLRSWVSDT